MEIKEVTDRKLMNMFIGFPYILYRKDPYFVPDLRTNQSKIFSGKNPFFTHSRVKLFLAVSRGKTVARIAAIDNTVHNEIYRERTAFFGFFETVMDYGVFTRLIEKVIEWARAEGFSRLIGPANFTTNDSCGFLVSGFDKMPVIHMPYNKDYYPEFFERAGFIKELDLFAYELAAENVRLHLGDQLTERIERKLSSEGITIRHVRFNDAEPEMEKLMRVYNQSNVENWGFIPLDWNEFRDMALDIKALVPENLVLFAEK
ncbi:MAG: hypothetical protein MUE74_12230, partial [Bacteroidales bacterium]|nr:hypothetical protein [Bacteroidales bacterium]